MTESRIIPVILSDDVDTRLWPVSRESFPKQFWPLVSECTLIQETALRAVGTIDARILLQPASRNSAPAIAAAAMLAAEQEPDAVLWTMAADATITDAAALHRSLQTAI
jgi:mannose-1-phosphate guanylyltransferase/mannose-6-phosphate isomerase